MDEFQSLEATDYASRELLYFWVFGDLHYRANEQWHAIHSRRMAPMFQDVNSLWLDEGFPAFCVSPGDIVDTGSSAKLQIRKNGPGSTFGEDTDSIQASAIMNIIPKVKRIRSIPPRNSASAGKSRCATHGRWAVSRVLCLTIPFHIGLARGEKIHT